MAPGTPQEKLSEKTQDEKWALTFDLGALEYEGFVPLKDWKIEVPLVGNYVAPDMTKLDQVVERFENLVVSNNLPFPRNDKAGTGSYARSAASLVAECIPHCPIDSDEMGSYLLLNLGGWWIDDIVELIGKDKDLVHNTKESSYFIEILRKVWAGGYTTPEDLYKDANYTDSFSHFYPTLVIWIHSQKLAEKSIPNYHEKLQRFIMWFKKYIEATYLFLRPDYDIKISVDTYRFLRVFDSGFNALSEFGLAVAQNALKPEIRDHMLYCLLQDLMCLVTGYINDITSLARDIARDQKLNYVRLVMEKEGITLKEAVNKTLKLIEELVSDVELTGKQLCEEFGYDPEVVKIYEDLKNIFNGSVTFYYHTSRYGPGIAGKPYKRSVKT